MDAANSSSLGPNTAITHVISNRSQAFGLTRARTATPNPIPTSTLALKTFQTRNPGATRETYDVHLAELVLSEKPDLVVLAGFMHILSPTFLESLPASLPIINLHPALPGQFDGARAIPRALEAFERGEVKGTGVMVHRVVAEVDRGAPVCVREVPIERGETLERLEERIHTVEHELIVEGAKSVLDEIREERRRRRVEETTTTTTTLESNKSEDGPSPTTTTRPAAPTDLQAPSSSNPPPAAAAAPETAADADAGAKTGLETLVGKLRIGKAGASSSSSAKVGQ